MLPEGDEAYGGAVRCCSPTLTASTMPLGAGYGGAMLLAAGYGGRPFGGGDGVVLVVVEATSMSRGGRRVRQGGMVTGAAMVLSKTRWCVVNRL